MIRQKEIFRGIVVVVGLKEVIFSLMALSAFFMPEWTAMKNMWNDLLLQLISPLILLIIGIYLLSGAKALIQFIYPQESEEELLTAKVIFLLGMKTIGIFLMIDQFESLFFNINTWLSMYGQFHNEITGPSPLVEYDIFRVIPFILFWFIFGLYLLKSGSIFTRIAFREKD